ncbi:NAD/NADP-dependent betaine aldehyde dehydrogenase [Phycisphaerales bacterium]|nr:NAD/NADP-dependent betaine aldehyde dehydrogenase [Phycisphaerales bacterium]
MADLASRLDVLKTYKLFIDGKFPRSESGRSWLVSNAKGRVVAHACRASRKDLRDAVEAARKAQPGWAAATAYLRGQILYRMAEMLEGKRRELAEAILATGAAGTARGAAREVAVAIDRLVHYAGWSDKFSQALGCHNPVSGPYYNFTIAEPSGVIAVVPPDESPLLALVSLAAPALCAGNTVVALCSGTNPIPAAVLGEVCATGDLPPGVLNLLTGEREELLKFISEHRDIDGVHAANLRADQAATLRLGAAENLKRVTVRERVDWFDESQCHSPWWIEPLVEMKTVWHPASA